MSNVRSRKLVLFPTLAILAPLFAACDSTVAPDLAEVDPRFATCRMDANGECIGTPTLGGRLTFASQDEFRAYLEPLQDASREELIASEQRNSFQSLRAYLDPNEDTQESASLNEGTDGPTGNEGRAWDQDGVVREDFPVSDAILSVLNSRGEIRIGQDVFKVTRDYVYRVAPDYVSVLNQKVPTLSSDAPADGDARITVQQVETTLPRESGEVLTAALTGERGPSFHHVPGVGSHCYVYAGDKRMHGKSYITNLLFYTEAGVTTEWERRKKFLWWTTWSNTWQPGTLQHSWESALVFGLWSGPFSPIGVPNGSQSIPSGSKVHKTVAWGVGFGVRIKGNIHARHSVSNIYVTGSCQTAASA